MNGCIFCRIVAGNIPAQKMAESDDAIAIADIHPQAPLHALVLPKTHVASLNDMTESDRRVMLPALYALADRLAREQGFRDRGYRTVINNQSDGGQTVFHLHMHVLGGTPLRHGFGA